ncbi:hypothetical protein MtrunA17_Chr3g0091881 [Medicago truncatula]|uniref:Uncharacterized protein n=1 Tax=Medicago truncatula TaxID=3880 RepID=A0A396ILL8_MEDTR|nr:hypothetical protein MtrunA17_Chr3g0091881 [Medicago truncatula]
MSYQKKKIVHSFSLSARLSLTFVLFSLGEVVSSAILFDTIVVIDGFPKRSISSHILAIASDFSVIRNP